MCPPTNFVVEYAINAWMDTSVPVDTDLAVKQWSVLRDTALDLGHEVRVLEPQPTLPDMVFAANGAFSIVIGLKLRALRREEPPAVHHANLAT